MISTPFLVLIWFGLPVGLFFLLRFAGMGRPIWAAIVAGIALILALSTFIAPSGWPFVPVGDNTRFYMQSIMGNWQLRIALVYLLAAFLLLGVMRLGETRLAFIAPLVVGLLHTGLGFGLAPSLAVGRQGDEVQEVIAINLAQIGALMITLAVGLVLALLVFRGLAALLGRG